MKKRLLCLFASILLAFSGCGIEDDSAENGKNITTTQSTTAASTITQNTTHFDSTLTTTVTKAPSNNNSTDLPDTETITSTTNSTTNSSVSQSSTTTSTTQTHPETVLFTATIRENTNGRLIAGVTMTVSTDTDTYTAVSDAKGVASVNVVKSNSYRVVLSTLPVDYVANTEYTFSGNRVNITIQKKKVFNENDHSGAGYKIGDIMTDFSLKDTDGNTYRLSELQKSKKLIILDFWYTACVPCKESFPHFESALKEYGDDIAFLAVDPIDSERNIQSFRRQYNATAQTPLTFPMAKDTCNLYLGLDVSSYPTTVFIDPNGRILSIHLGMYTSKEAVLAEIEKHIG